MCVDGRGAQAEAIVQQPPGRTERGGRDRPLGGNGNAWWMQQYELPAAEVRALHGQRGIKAIHGQFQGRGDFLHELRQFIRVFVPAKQQRSCGILAVIDRERLGRRTHLARMRVQSDQGALNGRVSTVDEKPVRRFLRAQQRTVRGRFIVRGDIGNPGRPVGVQAVRHRQIPGGHVVNASALVLLQIVAFFQQELVGHARIEAEDCMDHASARLLRADDERPGRQLDRIVRLSPDVGRVAGVERFGRNGVLDALSIEQIDEPVAA